MEVLDLVPVALTLLVLAVIASKFCPDHWQGWGGVSLIAFVIMPGGLVALAFLAQPIFLIPAVFLLGIAAATRT